MYTFVLAFLFIRPKFILAVYQSIKLNQIAKHKVLCYVVLCCVVFGWNALRVVLYCAVLCWVAMRCVVFSEDRIQLISHVKIKKIIINNPFQVIFRSLPATEVLRRHENTNPL